MDYASRFAERINNLHILKTVFYTYYRHFLSQTREDGWHIKVDKIRDWVKNRNRYSLNLALQARTISRIGD